MVALVVAITNRAWGAARVMCNLFVEIVDRVFLAALQCKSSKQKITLRMKAKVSPLMLMFEAAAQAR